MGSLFGLATKVQKNMVVKAEGHKVPRSTKKPVANLINSLQSLFGTHRVLMMAN